MIEAVEVQFLGEEMRKYEMRKNLPTRQIAPHGYRRQQLTPTEDSQMTMVMGAHSHTENCMS